METTSSLHGSTLEVAIEGRISSVSSKQFQEALADLDDVMRVELDFKDVAYISSAGLRVLLSVEKTMRAKGGELVIANANEEVVDTFDISGFSDFLTLV